MGEKADKVRQYYCAFVCGKGSSLAAGWVLGYLGSLAGYWHGVGEQTPCLGPQLEFHPVGLDCRERDQPACQGPDAYPVGDGRREAGLKSARRGG
jgi:hypothetical protein